MQTLALSNVTTGGHPILRREEIDPQRAETFGSDESVLYAGQHLGYQHPKAYKQAASSQLAGALRAIGLKPFVKASVDQYMLDEVERRTVNTGPLSRVCTGIAISRSGSVRGVVGFIQGLSCLAAIAGIVCVICSFFGSVPWVVSTSIFVGSASCFFLFLAIVAVGESTVAGWEWRKVPMDGYKGEIPPFALRTAAQVHGHAPDTSFYIYELHAKEVVRDPFLYAQDRKGNGFFLEVWKEPRFEQERHA